MVTTFIFKTILLLIFQVFNLWKYLNITTWSHRVISYIMLSDLHSQIGCSSSSSKMLHSEVELLFVPCGCLKMWRSNFIPDEVPLLCEKQFDGDNRGHQLTTQKPDTWGEQCRCPNFPTYTSRQKVRNKATSKRPSLKESYAGCWWYNYIK